MKLIKKYQVGNKVSLTPSQQYLKKYPNAPTSDTLDNGWFNGGFAPNQQAIDRGNLHATPASPAPVKAQPSKPVIVNKTPFADLLKKYPNANPSDTLTHNDPRMNLDVTPTPYNTALNKAFNTTYGENIVSDINTTITGHTTTPTVKKASKYATATGKTTNSQPYFDQQGYNEDVAKEQAMRKSGILYKAR